MEEHGIREIADGADPAEIRLFREAVPAIAAGTGLAAGVAADAFGGFLLKNPPALGGGAGLEGCDGGIAPGSRRAGRRR